MLSMFGTQKHLLTEEVNTACLISTDSGLEAALRTVSFIGAITEINRALTISECLVVSHWYTSLHRITNKYLTQVRRLAT